MVVGKLVDASPPPPLSPSLDSLRVIYLVTVRETGNGIWESSNVLH